VHEPAVDEKSVSREFAACDCDVAPVIFDQPSPSSLECIDFEPQTSERRDVSRGCPMPASTASTRASGAWGDSVDANTLLHRIALVPDVHVERRQPGRPLRRHLIHAVNHHTIDVVVEYGPWIATV